MKTQEEPKKRKPTRLKNFDYGANGAYYITICTRKRKCVLSKIDVGEGLAPPAVILTKIGQIVENQLLDLPRRYKSVNIDKYVIMPNHIHVIIEIQNEEGGASPSPTITQIIGTFKSISSIETNKEFGRGELFQRSFYDHIIRNNKDYAEIWEYIDTNPYKWNTDELYQQ